MTIHSLRKLCLAALTAGLLCATSVSFVQAQQGIGERLGERLDKGIDRLSSELREGWVSLKRTVDRMGVQGRVYSRLRWDKQVDSSEIEVDTGEAGVVVLRGNARSAEAKDKAVALARDTVGVERVVDELRIVAPPEPAAR